MFRDLRLAWKIKTALINENRELNYSEMLLLEKIGEKKNSFSSGKVFFTLIRLQDSFPSPLEKQ